MKRIFSAMCLFASMATATYAQIDETFVFTKGDGGEIVADGSTITVVEEPDANGYIHSGLYVKNTKNDWEACSAEVTIEAMPSGQHQICFPANCVTHKKVGTYETPEGDVDGNKSVDFQAEWITTAGNYGTCTVKYMLKTFDVEIKEILPGVTLPEYVFRANGPSVTVNYVYADLAGVNDNIAGKELKSVSYYDMSGREVAVPSDGVYIKKTVYADGTSQSGKVLVK